MKHKLKKLSALIMAFAMVMSLVVTAHAAGTTTIAASDVTSGTDAGYFADADALDFQVIATEEDVLAAFATAIGTGVTISATGDGTDASTDADDVVLSGLPGGYKFDQTDNKVAIGESDVTVKIQANDGTDIASFVLKFSDTSTLQGKQTAASTFKITATTAETPVTPAQDDDDMSSELPATANKVGVVAYEGDIPDNTIRVKMPVYSDEFDFILDPNDLIDATSGAALKRDSGMATVPTYTKSTVYFKNAVSAGTPSDATKTINGESYVVYSYIKGGETAETEIYSKDSGASFVDASGTAVTINTANDPKDSTPEKQTTTSGGTYSYSNTSDALTIYNKSNVKLTVKVAAETVDLPDGLTLAADDTFKVDGVDIATKAMYLGLIETAKGETPITKALAVPADGGQGKAEASATLAVEENAYELQYDESDGSYAYGLTDTWAAKETTDFPYVSFQLTGAANSNGWKGFTATPKIKVTWSVTEYEEASAAPSITESTFDASATLTFHANMGIGDEAATSVTVTEKEGGAAVQATIGAPDSKGDFTITITNSDSIRANDLTFTFNDTEATTINVTCTDKPVAPVVQDTAPSMDSATFDGTSNFTISGNMGSGSLAATDLTVYTGTNTAFNGYTVSDVAADGSFTISITTARAVRNNGLTILFNDDAATSVHMTHVG